MVKNLSIIIFTTLLVKMASSIILMRRHPNNKMVSLKENIVTY